MIYEFDRYVDGRLMAEGARIHFAVSEDDARAIARKLFAAGARPGEMERTKFVLTEIKSTDRIDGVSANPKEE